MAWRSAFSSAALYASVATEARWRSFSIFFRTSSRAVAVAGSPSAASCPGAPGVAGAEVVGAGSGAAYAVPAEASPPTQVMPHTSATAARVVLRMPVTLRPHKVISRQ